LIPGYYRGVLSGCLGVTKWLLGYSAWLPGCC